MLTEEQRYAAELVAKGEKIVDIAKLCKVSRQTVYDWKEKKDFKAEVDRFVNDIKTKSEKSIAMSLETYIKELEKIALTGKSEKNKLDALQYLVNRVLGNTTTKTEITTDNNKEDKKEFDLSILDQAIKEDSKDETYLS
ncbi:MULTISPECIES: phBC6A51 family helix-turn-helix protein [Paraclostridium]|uniref:Homeodomain phBC6A51-type domain-containing protein n=1 Tax=Paraclostridium benzoelyticum TaxID=1629550 RepID=A0A0M3DED0_9FIRM|nr:MULTISPECIES: phBC6A51 family helix-turn-helix protein [Paraclostridium]KKX99838.1 hypothetical protein VN21_17335 [Paraclostridium benzoelyticum]TQO55640.1 hypothetical protein D5S05_17290 [Paraclostridium bifermentans]